MQMSENKRQTVTADLVHWASGVGSCCSMRTPMLIQSHTRRRLSRKKIEERKIRCIPLVFVPSERIRRPLLPLKLTARHKQTSDRQTDRQTGRKTDWETDWQTNRPKDMYSTEKTDTRDLVSGPESFQHESTSQVSISPITCCGVSPSEYYQRYSSTSVRASPLLVRSWLEYLAKFGYETVSICISRYNYSSCATPTRTLFLTDWRGRPTHAHSFLLAWCIIVSTTFLWQRSNMREGGIIEFFDSCSTNTYNAQEQKISSTQAWSQYGGVME